MSNHVHAFLNDVDPLKSSIWMPSIQIIILVHPYNKLIYLPYSLGSIESQSYPKHRIKIKFHTERIYYEESPIQSSYDNSDHSDLLDEHIEQNDLTINIIKTWINNHRNEYNQLELSVKNVHVNSSVNLESEYWNTNRFKLLIETKSQALLDAYQSLVDYAVFYDADVIWSNVNTLVNLTSIVPQQDKVIVAPMLYSLGTYSNFWAGMDSNYYYRRTDDYLPILQRKRIGIFKVAMVHSCFAIDLRHKSSRYLSFHPMDVLPLNGHASVKPKIVPYDDIIAFATSATFHQIEQYVDNREVWGYIPEPVTSHNQIDSLQELADLELESLIGGIGFPLSPVLESYTRSIFADSDPKLGVDEVYVINLQRRPERKSRMVKSLKLLNIKAKFWNATDGKLLSQEFLQKHNIQTLVGYVDPYHKRPITFGEIGCFLSHYRIWEDANANNYSKVRSQLCV